MSSAPVSSSTAMPVSYTTMTVDDCPSASLETLITVTQGLTITYCPECEMGGSMAPSSTKKPGHTTVYTTTYLSLCETGTVPATYTVTESCEEETPTWTPGPSHVPNGFTVTVKECTVCDKTPVPVTITEPCDCEATSGTSIGPKLTQTPVEQIPDGQVQNPAPGGSGGSGPGPGPASTGGFSTPGEGCDGETCGGSGNQSPSPSGGSGSSGSTPPYPTTSAAAQCPGPECQVRPTGGAPGGGSDNFPSGNTTNITPPPYEGAASTSQTGAIVSLVLATVVGLFAFCL